MPKKRQKCISVPTLLANFGLEISRLFKLDIVVKRLVDRRRRNSVFRKNRKDKNLPTSFFPRYDFSTTSWSSSSSFEAHWLSKGSRSDWSIERDTRDLYDGSVWTYKWDFNQWEDFCNNKDHQLKTNPLSRKLKIDMRNLLRTIIRLIHRLILDINF